VVKIFTDPLHFGRNKATAERTAWAAVQLVTSH